MALQNCPECGHEVSDAASVCPNCGYQLKVKVAKWDDFRQKIKTDKRTQIISITATAVALLLLLAMTTPLFLSGEEKAAVAAVKELRAMCLVPSSLEVYELYVEHEDDEESSHSWNVYIRYGAQDRGGDVTEGEMNVFLDDSFHVETYNRKYSFWELYSASSEEEYKRMKLENIFVWKCGEPLSEEARKRVMRHA